MIMNVDGPHKEAVKQELRTWEKQARGRLEILIHTLKQYSRESAGQRTEG